MKIKKALALAGLVLAMLLVASLTGASNPASSTEKARVIIKVDRNFDDRAVEALNGKVIAKGKLFPFVVAEVPENAIEHLKKAKGVLRIERDAVVEIVGKPSNPPGRDKKGSDKPQQPPQEMPWGIERIKAQEAWGITNGSSDGVIEVAILDTGIDYNHPDLASNLAWGVSVLRGVISENPKDYKDVNGHGTHVAGTIAALNNEIGVVGVSPSVEIYAIKVLGNNGRGWVSDIISGIEQALYGPDGVLDSDGDGKIVGDPEDDAAEVISMSLGGSSDVPAFHEAIKNAYDYGVVIVAASGNEGASSPSYPAAYPEVIAVGATDSSDQVPRWSNRGAEVSAPGVAILSTYPDDTYETLSGTSMAAPHVSGVVALIQAAYYKNHGSVLPVGTFEDNTKSTVRGILHITAEDLGNLGLDADYGYGIVRADFAVQTVFN